MSYRLRRAFLGCMQGVAAVFMFRCIGIGGWRIFGAMAGLLIVLETEWHYRKLKL